MAIVYEHLRNDTNEVFYVGIGAEEKRAFNKKNRSPYWKHIVNKVGYSVNIIHKDIDWEEAKKIEILLIEKYGRKDLGKGNLVNLTDGGDGVLGLKHSEEARQKISEAGKGNTRSLGKSCSEEARQKISEAQKGKTHSEETREKMSKAQKGENNPNFGKTLSEEIRLKMSEAQKGKTRSEETREKMSKAQKGKTRSEETRQKLSEAGKGRTFSEETRQKLSEAQKGENNGFFGKKHSEETRQKYRNRTYSEETRKKMSEAKKGKTRSESFKKKNRENKRNQEGVKGYHFKEKTNKYYSSIHVMNKTIYLGSFDTPEEASEAYQKARLIYFA
jgi:hypothetical protein